MKVKLRVLHGSNAGREVKIPVREFIIGRKEGCHLRPRSDLVSRKHCAILLKSSGVIVRDLKSRNGTYVNGERIEGDCQLKSGDRLKVGKIEFEVLIDHGLGGTKKEKVKDVKEVAARTAAAAPQSHDEDDVTSWLEEADSLNRARMVDPDTRQFKLDETERIKLGGAAAAETISGAEADTADETTIVKKDKKKQQPGKLPKKPAIQAKDSGDAAAQVLKNFFNRR